MKAASQAVSHLFDPGHRLRNRGSGRCIYSRISGRRGEFARKDRNSPMFFFLSNRLGCAGSLLISLVLTLILLFLFRVI